VSGLFLANFDIYNQNLVSTELDRLVSRDSLKENKSKERKKEANKSLEAKDQKSRILFKSSKRALSKTVTK